MQLIARPDLGKKAYRLRCKFRIGRHPRPAFLENAKFAAADRFIEDMAKRGFEYVDRYGFTMTGPRAAIDVIAIPHRVRVPSAREMMAAVRQGARFLAQDDYGVQSVPLVTESAEWEYELAAVFVHKTILMEYADLHEEIRR